MTHRALSRLGPAFLVALMALSVAFTAAISSQRRWVLHTERVLAEIEATRAAQAEVRYRERDAVLGGGLADRVGRLAAIASARRGAGELRRLTADNPTQQVLIERLDGEWASYVRGSDEAVGSTGTMRSRIALTTAADHLRPFDQAGDTLQRMRQKEERLLAIREAALRRTYALFDGAIAATTLVMGLFLILLSRLSRRERRTRKEADGAVAVERAALTAAKIRLESLAAAAFEGISISQDGAVLDANPAFVEMFGYGSIEEVRGRSAQSFAAPESRDVVRRKHGACEEDPYEALLLRKDGSTFEAELRGRRIEVGGRPARVTAVRDLSGSKALEAELEARRDELERANASLLENQRVLDERLAETAEMNVVLEAQRFQLNAANERLAALATVDGLTGLTNQRAFRERLAEEHAEALRHGRDLSLLVMDVDSFKSYNDSFGHPAGDDALRTVARVLKADTRESDVAARNGGEEFALLLPGTDSEGAAMVAERVRRAVEGEPWRLRPVTVSLGIATLGPSFLSPTDFLEGADRALYAAKEGGRNRVRTAVPA